MRTHTNDFKTEIVPLGRQIKGKIYHYFNYEIDTEASDKIIAENDSYLILEGYNKDDKEELTNENIYSMKLIKNGELLQSLMKQFNFEAKYDLRIGDVVNPHFGLLVNDEYEFLDYGDYIIYSKQYNANNDTWDYVCYDLMLYSMIQYNGLNISYPITVKNYINAIANKMGVGFANINDAFTNSDELIYKDLFKDKNKTYRDILDKLAEITASNILINDNNELEVYYPKYVGEMADMSNSSIEITDSEKAKLQRFELEGKTTQETRSGKNLFNKEAYFYSNGATKTTLNTGVRITQNTTGTYRYNYVVLGGSELLGKTITISGEITSSSNNIGGFILSFGNSSTVVVNSIGSIYTSGGQTITIPSSFSANTDKIYLLLYSNLNGTGNVGDYVDYTNFQIEINSSATSYEDYGVSPSPDYPSELVSVGYENLLDLSYLTTQTINGVTITNNNGVITLNGTSTTGFAITTNHNIILSAGTYTHSVNQIKSGIYLSLNNVQDTMLYGSLNNLYKTFTISEETTYPTYLIFINSNITFNNFIIRPQLTKGTQAHSYIPYGKYGIEVKTNGKNLFNPNNLEQGWINTSGDVSSNPNRTRFKDYVKVKNATVYYLSSLGITSSENWWVHFYDENKQHISFYSSSQMIGSNNIFTTPNNCKYIKCAIAVQNTTISDVMLVESLTSITYEPYKSNTYLYTLDNPLRSIGDTKDLLYIKNGMLYVERKIGSVVLDGSENWYVYAQTYRINNFGAKPFSSFSTDNVLAYSNYFKWLNGNSGTFVEGAMWYILNGNELCLQKDQSPTSTTLATFKTWLSTHNTEVQYVLAEPYTEELGQVDMPSTYEGITYIETADSNTPTMNITYISQFEEIDEEYLKDVNVNFGEKFGQINRVALRDTENKIEYVAQDNISIEKNKLTQINIIDNPITLNGNEDNICQNILNKLNGLYYSINDFTTTGLCYYDFLDIFFVKLKDTRYQCLLLNNEITITQGIEETIFADAKSNSQVEGGNYETNYLTNKDIQTKITQLNDTKVESKSVINSINDSKEKVVISTEKIMYIKDFIGTTDANGFLDIELNSDFVVCSATASFNSNDYGFVIPYYDYNNGNTKWKLKIKDKNDVAVANTQIATTIYYFKKGRND